MKRIFRRVLSILIVMCLLFTSKGLTDFAYANTFDEGEVVEKTEELVDEVCELEEDELKLRKGKLDESDEEVELDEETESNEDEFFDDEEIEEDVNDGEIIEPKAEEPEYEEEPEYDEEPKYDEEPEYDEELEEDDDTRPGEFNEPQAEETRIGELNEPQLDDIEKATEETTEEKIEETIEETTEEATEETTEETIEELEDIIIASPSEAEEMDLEVVDGEEKLFGAFALRFGTDSGWGGKEYVIDDDIEIAGSTSQRSKNVGDTITAPTCRIKNSTESSKGLSFAYWYNIGNGTKINSGANYTVAASDENYGRSYVTFFTDNRKSLTIAPHSSAASYVTINNPSDSETNGWVISDNKAIRKSRITQAWLNDIIDNLQFSAGYGYDKIVNSSGTEVNPVSSWDRNNNVTYYIKAKVVGASVSFDLQGHGSPIDNQIVNIGSKVIKPSDPTDSNWTFGGWYKESACTNAWDFNTNISSGTTSLTLYAKWTEKYNTVNFHMGTGESISVANPYTRYYTQTFTLPNPTKTGYEFGGWYDNSGLTGTSISSITNNTNATIDLYPKWTEKSYNVSFNLDGGTITISNPSTRKYSEGFDLSSITPTKTGFTFKNWHKDSLTGGVITSIPANTTSDVSVFAEWEENSYTVTYHFGDGVTHKNSYSPKTSRKYTESITLPISNELEKVGHTIDGWYTDSSFTSSKITELSGNTEVAYEVWLKWNVNNYSISYNLNGGAFVDGFSKIDNRNYLVEVTLPTEENVKKTGYKFEGWFTESTYTNKITKVEANTLANVEIFAKWEEKKYKVNWYLNGGTIANSYTKVDERLYTQSITLPTETEITKEFYDFEGWYDNNTFTGSPITNLSGSYDGEYSVFAKWDGESYTIAYNLDGGSFEGGYHEPTVHDYNTTVDLPPSDKVTKTGYTFKGWYDNSSFTGNPITTIPASVTTDSNIYAKWEVNKYRVSYVVNGGAYLNGYSPKNERAYNENVNLPTDAQIEKQYHVFRGWYDNESLSGSAVTTIAANSLVGDKTYYARWEIDPAYAGTTVYLRFDSDGGNGTMADIPYTFYDEASVPVNEFSKTGYTFSNWVDENGVVVSSNFRMVGDVTLKAIWTQNYVPRSFGGGSSSGGGGSSEISDPRRGPLGDTTSVWFKARNVLSKESSTYMHQGPKRWVKNDDGTFGLIIDNNVKVSNVWIEDMNINESGNLVVDTYAFDEEGKMITGMATDGKGNVYHFETENNANQGKMTKGWKLIGGGWHFFGLDGRMFFGGMTPDGYIVDANGRWVAA